MPGDVFVSQNRPEVAGDLVGRVNKAASGDQHRCSQWSCHSNHSQELGNVWSQTEWHRTIGVQLA